MTVRETPVRTMLASRRAANSYSRSIHQSVSLRASHGEASCASMAGGMRVPVCGMHSRTGAKPRRTVSHGAEDSSIIGAEPSRSCVVLAFLIEATRNGCCDRPANCAIVTMWSKSGSGNEWSHPSGLGHAHCAAESQTRGARMAERCGNRSQHRVELGERNQRQGGAALRG